MYIDIDLAANLAQLRPGDHLCYLYATEAEHQTVLSLFILQGLMRGEKVLYILDYHTADEIFAYLRDRMPSLDDYVARGQLQFLSTAETYLQDDHFTPEHTLDLLRQATLQAQSEGYPALRVTGEMSWALRGLPGSDQLIEYEAKLNHFFQHTPCIAVCQYDQRRFNEALLLDVLETHPLAIIGTEIYENFYYAPPDELLRGDRARWQLARWLQRLAERRQLDRQLAAHRRSLEAQVTARTHELEEANRRLQREVEERWQAEYALRQSTAFLKQTQRITQVGGWEYDVSTQQAIWTEETYRIYEVDTDFDPSDIRRSLSFYAPRDQAQIEQAFQRAVERGESYDLELQLISATGRTKWVRTSGQADSVDGRVVRVFGNIIDITQRKRSELTLQARLRLSQYAAAHTLHELLVATLDEAGALTGSPIGFYHFLEPDQKTLALQAWSTRTTAEFCTAEGAGQHYDIDQAGVWVECVRERRAIIHNDYAALPAARRKGLPPGHAAVTRELVVPVFRGDLIVAILGVGNKSQFYDEQDLSAVSLLADLAWEIAERKQAEEAWRETDERYRQLVDASPMAVVVMQDGQVQFANEAARRMSGHATTRDMLGLSIADFIDPDWRATAYERARLVGEGQVAPTNQVKMRRVDGTVYYAEVTSVPIAYGGRPAMLTLGHDVTERRRSAEAEHEQRTLAEALADTVRALTSTLNLDEVLDRVLLNVGRVVPHDAANIMLLNAARDTAYVARYRGFEPSGSELLVRSLQFGVSQAPNLRYMYATGQPLVIADVRDYAGWITGPGRDWIRSFAGVPIRSQDQVIGFLSLYSAQPNFYIDAHALRLQAFADQVAVAVQNAQLHARIQTHADELETRVAERTRDLTLANERLTELDHLKDEFISRISHELRTPLANIKIYLELLETGKPEKHARYLQTLNEQTVRLQVLIENLLDVSHLDMRNVELHVTPIDLNHVAQDLVAGYRQSARPRRQTLAAELAADLPRVNTDALLLAQALSNIMTNALAYTPAEGYVTVQTAVQLLDNQPWVTLTVRDTGPGISAEDLSHIFERFYRGAAARDYRTPGTGLGLSISQAIITRLGGRLTVDSSLGQGAVFTIWLPVA